MLSAKWIKNKLILAANPVVLNSSFKNESGYGDTNKLFVKNKIILKIIQIGIISRVIRSCFFSFK